MPLTFSNYGVSFQYPDNWKLEETPEDGEAAQITVQSPGTGFWTASLLPASQAPDDVLGAVLAAMEEEYEEVESESITGEFFHRPHHTCEIHFYCLDFTNTAMAHVFRESDQNILVVYQAEDREFADLEDVFRAMTLTLLQSLSPEAP